MRALCIGSAMIDIIVMVESRNIERMTMHNVPSSFLLLEQGAKVEAESISSHCGGGAVNSSVAMRRLGAEATAFAKIGRDANGDRIFGFLTGQDVDTSRVMSTSEAATGQAVLVSSHDRNQTIFTQRGANGLIKEEDFADDPFAARDLVYVSGLSNRSADRFPLIMTQAISSGAFVAANPGIRQITSRTEALLSSTKDLGLIAVNRVEANALVPAVAARAGSRPGRTVGDLGRPDDLPRLLRLGLSFGGFDMGLVEFLAGLLKVSGAKRAAVTDGTEGAFLADETGLHHSPTVIVDVMGTAGAGDAFTSTLSLMLAEGADPAQALRAAAINSAAVVTFADTTSGLLDRKAIEGRLTSLKESLPVRFWPWAA